MAQLAAQDRRFPWLDWSTPVRPDTEGVESEDQLLTIEIMTPETAAHSDLCHGTKRRAVAHVAEIHRDGMNE